MRWILLLSWLFPSLCFAQVNVEKLRSSGVAEGSSGSAALSTALSTGNIQLADFNLSGAQTYKHGAHTVFAVINGRFAAKRTQADLEADPSVTLWSKDARFANALMAHLRYSYELGPQAWIETFTQYEYNAFLLLDRRLIGGLGPRLGLLHGKQGTVVFGTAAMVEEERLNAELIAPEEEVQRVNLRSSSYISGTWKPGDGIAWTSTAYFQPMFTAFSDFRVLAETGLSFAVSKRFAFTLDVLYKRDSMPPKTPEGSADVRPADLSIKNGLKVSW